MNNIFEIGMKMEIYENRLLFIKKDLKKELNEHEIDWQHINRLSMKALDYDKKIKEQFNLKLKYIQQGTLKELL